MRRMCAVDHKIRGIARSFRIDFLDGAFEGLTGGKPAVGLHGERHGHRHTGLPRRLHHPHGMPAVDVALHDWPDAELGPQLRAEQLEGIEFQRKSALCASICVNPGETAGSTVDVYLHNEFSAHAWPSGATQDRRAWLEVLAYSGGASVLEVGVLDEGQSVSSIADDPLTCVARGGGRVIELIDEHGPAVFGLE